MVFHIKKENGFWTVNGDRLEALNATGQNFMEAFFMEMKIENPIKNNHPENNPLVKRVHHRD